MTTQLGKASRKSFRKRTEMRINNHRRFGGNNHRAGSIDSIPKRTSKVGVSQEKNGTKKSSGHSKLFR
jgi:hypothetical protein